MLRGVSGGSGGGGGGTPGGSDTEVQYNNAGSFGGVSKATVNASGTLNILSEVVAVTGTTKTLGLTDANSIQDCSNASPQLITIPANGTIAFPINTVIMLEQNGAGALSVVGDTGVTLNGTVAGVVTAGGQYTSFYIRKEATNTWVAESAGAANTAAILGSSVSACSPAISGDLTSGFYTAGAGKVDVSISGVNVVEWASTGSTLTGTSTITSSSAAALSVGANGATAPVLSVDANTASVVTGVAIKGGAASGTTSLTASTSGADASISLVSKGAGNVTLNAVSGSGAVRIQSSSGTKVSVAGGVTITPSATAAAPGLLYSSQADTSLTASTEAISINFNMNANQRQHSTGALTLQRDMLITGTTHNFVGASALTTQATLAVVLRGGGTNSTLTNANGILIQTVALGGTPTNSYGLNITAASGATNNYAALFAGQVINGGATPAIAAGVGAGTTPTVSVAGCNNGGVLTITTGSAPTGSNATIATITFTNPFPNGSAVTISPANAVTAALADALTPFVAGTTTTFVLTSGATNLVASTAYLWNYTVVGY